MDARTVQAVPVTQGRFDPVQLEIMAGAFQTVADDIGHVLERTAYSNIVVDAHDCSTAVLDRNGRMIAQGPYIPIHLGVMAEALPLVVDRLGGWDTLHDGDMIISNDPFCGGTHLPDVMVFAPVFYGGKRIAFTATLAHWVDVGGRVLGGMSCDATESYQEGLRISPTKLYSEGKLNDGLLQVIRDNVRLSEEVVGDLMAQVSGCLVGQRRVLELVEKYGVETLLTYMATLQDYSERLMRAEIASWPDGEYEAEDFLDNDGVTDRPVRICVRVTVRGSDLFVDFSGSSAQTLGPFNSTINSTKSSVYGLVRCLVDPNVPANAGIHRPVHVAASPGTVVNCELPAATGPRGATLIRIGDVFLHALAQALPDRVPAACDGSLLGSRIYGYRPNRSYFGYNDGVIGGTGGRPTSDGSDGMCFGIINYRNRSIEDLEQRYPVRFECYEFRPDSGGRGKFRGGLGLHREVRALQDATLTVRNERQIFAPYGLYGGEPGQRGLVSVDGKPINPKATHYPLRSGEVFEMRTAGGGGWGDFSERSQDLIERDLADEKITPEWLNGLGTAES